MSAKNEGLGAKFDSLVTRLDDWLKSRKSNELYLIALAIPALLLLGDWKFVIPKVEKVSVEKRAIYERNYKEIEDFRQSGGLQEVERLRVETQLLQDNIERVVATEAYIQSRLTELDHLFFTRLEWAQHLDFVTQKATDYQVSILVQENVVEAEKPGFNPVMSVDLNGRGGFTSVLRYLFLVEASEKITPIEALSLEIDEENRVAFKAKSVLWGLR
ncbi:MAG: hypothetical protein LBP89_03175 [Helicobacteraceae bacterium]|jgi:hypothetical protein|nr:hypothetical protein [Helicobacteraceae bacterium]